MDNLVVQIKDMAIYSYEFHKGKAMSNYTKADIYRERVTLPLSKEQRAYLQKLVLEINDNGKEKTERITVSSVIRASIDAFLLKGFDISGVKDEITLKRAIKGTRK